RISRRATDEAIDGADDSFDAGGAASEGHCPLRAVPIWADHDVVAIRQRRDAITADCITDGAADKAVGGADDALDAAGAAAEGDRPDKAVPIRAVHHVVAVAQRRDAVDADLITGPATDEAVGGADDALDAGDAATESRRPDIAVPI